ncbi:MAG: hypothetical protein ACPGSD_15730 [Flavobacteriales bacterium]
MLNELFIHRDVYHKLSLEANDTIHIEKSNYFKSQYFARINKLDSALFYDLKYLEIGIKNVKLKQNTLINISNYYSLKNELDSALIYGKESLKIAKENTFDKSIINSYSTISDIYYKRNNIKMTISYSDSAYQSLLNLSKESNLINDLKVEYQLGILHRLGNIQMNVQNYEKAKKYYKKAQTIAVEKNIPFYLAFVNNGLIDAYLKLNKLDSAEYILQLNENSKYYSNNLMIKTNTIRRRIDLLEKRKKYSEALDLINRSLESSKLQPKNKNVLILKKSMSLAQLGLSEEFYSTYKLIDTSLIKGQEMTIDYLEAPFIIKLQPDEKIFYHQIKDGLESVKNRSNESKMIDFEIRYQTSQLKINNLALANKNALNKIKEIRTKRYVTFLIIALLIASISILVFIYINNKIKKKNIVISNQKKDLELVNKDLEKKNILISNQKKDLELANKNLEDRNGIISNQNHMLLKIRKRNKANHNNKVSIKVINDGVLNESNKKDKKYFRTEDKENNELYPSDIVTVMTSSFYQSSYPNIDLNSMFNIPNDYKDWKNLFFIFLKNREVLITDLSISKLSASFSESSLRKVNQSVLINMDFIKGIVNDDLILEYRSSGVIEEVEKTIPFEIKVPKRSEVYKKFINDYKLYSGNDLISLNK